MELVVRGLMALALIDCPEADVCPGGAAILIPDTSYFEKLGLHEHSATLSIPLAWIDSKHGGDDSYAVVDVGGEPMAVFTLEPGEQLVLGSIDELAVRPLRGEPVTGRSDAPRLPLSQLLQADELVEQPELDVEHVRNVIWIRSGSIAARTLYGSDVVVEGREVDLTFRAPGARGFKPRPLATEVVVQLPERGLTLGRSSPSVAGGYVVLPLHRTRTDVMSGPTMVLGNLPKGLPLMPGADQRVLNLLTKGVRKTTVFEDFGLTPSDPELTIDWDCDDETCERDRPREWNPRLCPSHFLSVSLEDVCRTRTMVTCSPGYSPYTTLNSGEVCVLDGRAPALAAAGVCPRGTTPQPLVGDGCVVHCK